VDFSAAALAAALDYAGSAGWAQELNGCHSAFTSQQVFGEVGQI